MPDCSKEAAYFIAVPEWLAVAKLSPQALALYVVLLGHVNRERGDDLAWPTMDTLAGLLGYSKRQSLLPYLDELVALEVVEVVVRPTDKGRRNYYRVTKKPPSWWQGPLSIPRFHADRGTAGEVGLSAVPDDPSSAVGDDPWSAVPDENQTKTTRRRNTHEETSGDTSGAAPRTSSQRAKKTSRFDGRIHLTPPAAFFKGAWEDGRVQQWMVGAAVAALENAGKHVPTGARDIIGQQIDAVYDRDRREDLLLSLEDRLTEAVRGEPGLAWLFDPDNKRPPRPRWQDVVDMAGTTDPEEALIDHLYETEDAFGIDATVYSMSERYHPNAIANTIRMRGMGA